MPASELGLLSAFLMGLLGSVHCLGMCGGIVGVLTLGIDPRQRATLPRLAPYLLLYNAGRITSYAAAGLLAGGLGALAFAWLDPDKALTVARLVAAGFMVALGLYLAGWWSGLLALEKLGGRFWRRIEPAGRRFLPVRQPWQAFAAGILWGWLPCGLVYTALAWSLLGGSAQRGALLMVAFGLGTLPTMFAAGAAADRLARVVRQPGVRAAAGALVIAFGLYTLLAVSGAHTGHDAIATTAGKHAGH
jgi:sulfite exporter TauE/SafE